MCERITFPVKVCESCVIQRVMNGAYDRQLFLQPQRQTKTSLMKHNLLLWQTPLLPNCFCSCGSNVSCNHLGMRVYLMVAWSCVFRPTTEEVCAGFCHFQPPVVEIIERTNVICLRVGSSCCFMNLVWLRGTFRVAPWSVETQSVSSCWISAHLVLWDPWNIKKAVCDLTIEPGQTFTRNQEKSRSGPPWL